MSGITDRDVEVYSRLLSSALNVLSRAPFVNKYLIPDALRPNVASLRIEDMKSDALGLASWMVEAARDWADKNQEL